MSGVVSVRTGVCLRHRHQSASGRTRTFCSGGGCLYPARPWSRSPQGVLLLLLLLLLCFCFFFYDKVYLTIFGRHRNSVEADKEEQMFCLECYYGSTFVLPSFLPSSSLLSLIYFFPRSLLVCLLFFSFCLCLFLSFFLFLFLPSFLSFFLCLFASSFLLKLSHFSAPSSTRDESIISPK